MARVTPAVSPKSSALKMTSITYSHRLYRRRHRVKVLIDECRKLGNRQLRAIVIAAHQQMLIRKLSAKLHIDRSKKIEEVDRREAEIFAQPGLLTQLDVL